MWIYTKHGMASVVCCLDENRQVMNHLLIVRARTHQDLNDILEEGGFKERKCDIRYSPSSDYAYRVKMLKSEVMYMVQLLAKDIDYSNFKNACHDVDPDFARERMLIETWQAAVTYQTRKGKLSNE